jgi:hypothetical protein
VSLEERAKQAAESGAIPASWGESIEIEVGDSFRGRFRGHDDGGRSGAWLFWDTAGDERFLWGSYRLDREFERESVPIGAKVVVYRAENYSSQYDDEGEATGLSYGIAWEESSDPLLEGGEDEDEDDILW